MEAPPFTAGEDVTDTTDPADSPTLVTADPLSKGEQYLGVVVDTEQRTDSCWPWFVVKINGSRYRVGRDGLRSR